MYCPNCGSDCGDYKFCPNCGMKLPGQAQPPVQPARERPPALFPWEIPFGRLEVNFGYIEMGATEVVFYHNAPIQGEFCTKIPYNLITKVAYQPADHIDIAYGHLSVRWVGNQYLPLPTKGFPADVTTGCFESVSNDAAYRIYCALQTAALRNNIKDVDFSAKRAELNAAGAFYCPACLSVDISTRGWGYNWGLGLGGAIRYPMFGAWLGTIGMRNQKHRCNNCGHLWNTFR